MTAPTSLAETLCRGAHPTRWEVRSRILPPCDDCARAAEAARAWLVARLAKQGAEVVRQHEFNVVHSVCACGHAQRRYDHAAHVAAALAGVLTDE